MVWTGRGFQPGETVLLWWDGHYRVYLTALPEGTWSVEWYDQPREPPNARNLPVRPGPHRFEAGGNRGDRAWTQIIVR